ncbi:MAG: hypothetical protein ACJ790_03350, partial [Myxococcaceae bacterium]
MSGRVVFFLQHASYEPAYQVASMAITSAAMGDEVYIVFSFDALRSLSRNAFGLPHTEREIAESARSEGLGVPVPIKMLSEARQLGVKLIACDTNLKLCGFSADDFATKLDEVMGLASIWR